jgi:alkaline phosphatase D
VRLRAAIACCQHYESGYYAAYRSIVEADPDLIVHLGDYIYEDRGIQPSAGRVPARSHDLPEAFTLEDYRARYALYKLDPDLQAAHAAAPWLVTWDDHEVDNDYAGEISIDDDPPAHFLERRAAAYQAYYEHMPLPRRHVPLGGHMRLRARVGWGGLAEIVLLDGRQFRSDQACGGRLVEPCQALYDETRTMLGKAQERWLERTLAASRARWNLLAQQTVFAHMDQAEGEAIGYWADGWSGYPAARQRTVDLLTGAGVRNPVILSGDAHGYLVNDIHSRPGDPESPIAAAELVTTSISSNGPPQQTFDSWRNGNPNVRFARSDRRGYTLLTATPGSLQAALVTVDDPHRGASGTSTLATFDIEDGRSGVAR